jgi:similar to stage IV sporulation protein
MEYKWTRGTTRMRIRGLGIDKLMEDARASNLILYDMARPGRMELVCSLSFRQARQLQAMAIDRELTVEVLGRWGLPALVLRALGRPALVIGFLLAFIGLVFFSTRVWEIQIVGLDGARSRQVQDFLAQRGLYFGASSGAVRINSLEYQTMLAFPELRFVGIRVAGVRATVTVARQPEKGGEPAKPGTHVVANRSGRIERITVTQGTARVKAGDVVGAGQLLVEGVMTYEDGREPRIVAADGEVMARVWITAAVSGSLTRVEADPQGKVYQKWTLILGQRQLPLSFGSPKGDMVLESVEAWRLPGFAAAAPVSLEKRQYRQGKLAQVPYESLLKQLQSQAGAEALRLLPEDGQVLERSERMEVDGDTLTLTVSLEVLCDIALQQP